MNIASIRRLMHGEAFVSPNQRPPSAERTYTYVRQFDIRC